LATRRSSGEEVRVPGGLPDGEGRRFPGEAAAAEGWGRGENEEITLTPHVPLRDIAASLTPGAREVRPGARGPGCPVDRPGARGGQRVFTEDRGDFPCLSAHISSNHSP
jgi:hypothetical protein